MQAQILGPAFEPTLVPPLLWLTKKPAGFGTIWARAFTKCSSGPAMSSGLRARAQARSSSNAHSDLELSCAASFKILTKRNLEQLIFEPTNSQFCNQHAYFIKPRIVLFILEVERAQFFLTLAEL